MRRSGLVGFVAIAFAFHAAPAGKFALTVDNIMRGHGLFGWEPSQLRWSSDSERIYFQWKQAGDRLNQDPDTYVVNRDGSDLRKLSDAEAEAAPPASGAKSRDLKRTVYVRDGDIFLYDSTTGETHRITKTEEPETNPHLTRDGHRIAFTRANNLYAIALDTGLLEQLTEIRPPGAVNENKTSPDEKKGTASQEYLKKQEKELLEAVRERAAKREEEEAKRKLEHPRKPFTLETGQTVASLDLTPDEKYVLAGIKQPGKDAKRTIIPNYVTESAYTEDISSREKVGDSQEHVRFALLSTATGEATWIEPEPKTRDGAAELSRPVWSEDGARAAMLARAADNKDRWILALDETTGKTRVLAHDHDDAWVDGPGAGTLGWMKSDRDVYFQSERTGYSQLYAVSFDGGEPRALTSGNFEVDDVVMSNDKTRFFLTTSEGDPGQRNVYEMSADGGARVRLTAITGRHSAVLSPDEHWFADVYSYTNKPPELYVQAAASAAAAAKLTSSPAPDFWEYPWLDAPIVTFPARDGVALRAQVFKPANFRKGGPAVIFVHGAGYLQNVHRWWSSEYTREYLFHHLLMERGYMVINVDYRGSAGYGRDWRTAIYRHMGGQDLDDQVDAARWLVAQEGVDAKRIGLYGGSYGGFITLMAMFTQSEVFAAGAALRPVTDWANYNDGYTSNILNTPQKDAEAYRQSSPIFFASGLKGALLICHGMVDTNVHFQDTVELVETLIELRKENWQLAVYPVENHGFIEPASWADEYKRILDLFEKNLKAH
jgi:dipeptidyl aminopeptidase/acylaminoacyl peptidase